MNKIIDEENIWLTTVRRLAKHITRRDKDGYTSLMYAAVNSGQNTFEISALLYAHADIEIRNKEGYTPLMLASRYNHNPEVVSILLERGAEVNARNRYGWNALMIAAKYNKNPKVLSVLINYGADAKVKTDDGRTAFDIAEENDDMVNTQAYWKLNDLLYR